MPDINSIHKFYESNLPGYERKDVFEVNRFFLQQIGMPGKNVISEAVMNFDRFRKFICDEWHGTEISYKKNKLEKEYEYGRCKAPSCSGHMIKRHNRRDGSPFLGCSRYPKCNYTQPLDE